MDMRLRIQDSIYKDISHKKRIKKIMKELHSCSLRIDQNGKSYGS